MPIERKGSEAWLLGAHDRTVYGSGHTLEHAEAGMMTTIAVQ